MADPQSGIIISSLVCIHRPKTQSLPSLSYINANQNIEDNCIWICIVFTYLARVHSPFASLSLVLIDSISAYVYLYLVAFLFISVLRRNFDQPFASRCFIQVFFCIPIVNIFLDRLLKSSSFYLRWFELGLHALLMHSVSWVRSEHRSTFYRQFRP